MEPTLNTLADPTSLGILEELVRFTSGPNLLEGVLAYPEAGEPNRAVLLLSPHPHLGGRMDNNVITFLAHALAGEGCATLRFNYRGVGGSTLREEGEELAFEYWSRVEATQNYRMILPDAVAARDFLEAAVPGARSGYVGYSFGACLALLLAEDSPPAWLGLVAPPVSRAPVTGWAGVTMPCVVVTGDRDFTFASEEFQPAYDSIPGQKRFVLLQDCDHFFRKRELDLYGALRPLWRATR